MRDYAGNYQVKGRRMAVPQRQRRGGWRTMSRSETNSALFWKTLGIIMLLAAAVGVAASYWVGHCIQESLVEISQAQELRSEKQQAKTALLDEQARLLQAKRLEAFAAVQVGLYSPGKRQKVAFR